MNTLLIFLIKSTLSLSLLYLAFRILMREETFFKLSRLVLLFMVLTAVIIPFIHSPQLFQPIKTVQLEPIFQSQAVFEEPIPVTVAPEAIQSSAPTTEPSQTFTILYKTFILFVYFFGLIVSFLMLVYSIISVLLLFRKARKIKLDRIYLRIVTDDIPAFSFGCNILISEHDYDTNSDAIIAHELSHIRLGHFYDLMLMELAKIIFWFNPLVYRIVRDLKEIHEFQADDYTLNSGIDATQYQLLIIQKSVGHQKFALANSFNHCQIKNRITMMNKQKNSKGWRWKVATFLPLFALLLMAFGKPGENVPQDHNLLSTEVFTNSTDSVKQWTEADFKMLADNGLEKLFFEGKNYKLILLNAKSKLIFGNDMTSFVDLPDSIRKYRDYNLADNQSDFEKTSINGIKKMASTTMLLIRSDISVPYIDFKNLVNTIGNTILELRGKYSIEIFGVSYQNLTKLQRTEIDKLIPLNVCLGNPVKATGIKTPSSFTIEIRKDGYYIDNKLCSLEETKQKVELWKKNNAEGITSIRTEEEVPMSRITEIKEMLRNISVTHINYSMHKPSKIVDEYPRFSGGQLALRKWIAQNVKYPKVALENRIQGKVYVRFTVNTEGKVEDPIVMREIDPALDAEALRVVSQMPKWEPAKKDGVPVSADYTVPITFSLQ